MNFNLENLRYLKCSNNNFFTFKKISEITQDYLSESVQKEDEYRTMKTVFEIISIVPNNLSKYRLSQLN